MQIEFNPQILSEYFTNKTVESCKSCKRYNTKATCPPNTEPMWYWQLLLPNYSCGILVIEEFKIDNPENWRELGKSSSLVIAKKLYLLRTEIKDYTYLICFGAGSCKYCSEECQLPCKHPDMGLMPFEATGLNIIKLVKDLVGIELKFPVKDTFFRIGAVLYDKK